MRRGCMAVGEICCDECGRIIRHSEPYLVFEEEEDSGEEEGRILRYCQDCCLDRGYATHKEDKGERVLTFFPEQISYE